MRIGIVAQAAGTTPRAVRHYHRLGLLPDPVRTPSGYRDYSMNDLMRLMRVRRLADSGVPLGSIAAMTGINADSCDVVEDITDLLSGIEHDLKELKSKKSRLLALLADARDGRQLTALPRQLEDRLTQLIDHSDGVTRVELEKERDHLEVLALSGKLPDEFTSAMAATLRDPTSVASYLTLLKRWSDLEGRNPVAESNEIDALALEMADLVAMSLAGTPALATVESTDLLLLDLDDVVPDAAQRAVVVRAAGIVSDGVP